MDGEFIKGIMNDIEEYFIRNNKQYNLPSKYEYIKEVIMLYGKQHNLIQSTLLLLDNNMCEEAYILARSVLNNNFLIAYLLECDNDERQKRFKMYKMQPVISEISYWKNFKEIITGPYLQELKAEGKRLQYNIDDVQKRITKLEKKLKDNGQKVNSKLFSIAKLAKKSGRGEFEIYATYYSDACRYEHSDISSLNIYLREYNGSNGTDIKFRIDVNKTDERLKSKVQFIIDKAYFDSLIKISENITSVLNECPSLKDAYEVEELVKIAFRVKQYIKTI